MTNWSEWAWDGDDLVPLPIRQPDPAVVVWAVICTGRGQHPPRRMCDLFDRRATVLGDLLALVPLSLLDTGGTRAARARVQTERLAFLASNPDPAPTGTPVFRCKTCRRSVALSLARLGALLDARTADDPTRRVLDVSLQH